LNGKWLVVYGRWPRSECSPKVVKHPNAFALGFLSVWAEAELKDFYLFIFFFFLGGGGAWTRRLHSRVGANMQSVLISLFADVISS
jgi:hypothetical protein